MKRIASTAARSAPWLLFLAIGLTVVPAGAQPADSGEFQLVARDLGVAHPPGYPLYTLSAHLFGRLVLAIPPLRHLGWPWAVNAFSMVLAVATLFVVARTATRLGGSWLGGAIAVALLWFAPTFVAQALVANIRMATGLFAAVVLGLTLDVVGHGGPLPPTEDSAHPPTPSLKVGGGGGSRDEGGRSLVALCFVGALAAGHHPTLAALALPLGLAILVRRPAVLRDRRALPRLAAMCVAATVIGLLPLLYLPIRAAQHAPLAPADLATWGGVWRHVTAAGFRGDMLAITGARDLGDRLLVLGNILHLQFAPLALGLMAVGAVWLIIRRRAEAVALLGTALVVSWLAITYRAPQTMEYLLPAYVALAIVAGGCAGVPLRRLRDILLPHTWGPMAIGSSGARPARRWLTRRGLVAAWIIVAVPCLVAIDFMDPGGVHSHAHNAIPHLEGLTAIAADPQCVAANGTVLANWHYVTPLWLAGKRATTTRPGIDAPYVTATGAPIVYVHPDFQTGDPIGVTWQKAAQAAVARGPVLLTNRTRELNEAGPPVKPIPESPWWQAGAAGGTESACRLGSTHPVTVTADFDDAGQRWSLSDVRLMWHAARFVIQATITAPPGANSHDVTAFAQLVGPTIVVGQADQPIGLPWSTDASGAATYLVSLPLQADQTVDRNTELALVVGLYRHAADGPHRLSVVGAPTGGGAVVDDGTAIRFSPKWLGETNLVAWHSPPPGAIPFGAAMSILRSSVQRTATDLIVDIVWHAEDYPWASDYTVSVQAAADDASWRAQHDGTPALGAIPTLKWLPGMIIHDRHRIPLPPEAAGHDGPFTVSVGVYDAFSLEPLPVTDGALVRAGQGQRAILHPTP
ncbi:MAG: DUF2723 domain-containing protein [Ardenticatenales bacterium]